MDHSSSLYQTICDKPLARSLVELSGLALIPTGALAWFFPHIGQVMGAAFGIFEIVFFITFSAFWVGLILYRACRIRECQCQPASTDTSHDA